MPKPLQPQAPQPQSSDAVVPVLAATSTASRFLKVTDAQTNMNANFLYPVINDWYSPKSKIAFET